MRLHGLARRDMSTCGKGRCAAAPSKETKNKMVPMTKQKRQPDAGNLLSMSSVALLDAT